VVTGIGLVTPLGRDVAQVRVRIARGERAEARPVPQAPSLRLTALDDFDPREFFRVPKALKLADRKTQLAVAAAALAVDDAGLSAVADREAWAVVLGCSASSPRIVDLARALDGEASARAAEDLALFAERILGALNPLWLLLTLPNMVGAHVGIQLATQGPNHTVTSDWVAGTQAIGEAWLAIAGGECDVALAGGADAVDPFDLGCLAQGSRPAADGDAFVVGEGAAVLVLEELEHALRRGARVRGEVRGYGAGPGGCGRRTTVDAIGTTLSRALTSGGSSPAEVAWLATGAGPGHPWAEDERAALAGVLASPPGAILAAEEALGHSLAAAGAIDAALLVAALSDEPPSSLGLALTVGTVGQSAALLLAGPGGA
jgi:3-oxoacyl-(acyl-carrier-protein) synthase